MAKFINKKEQVFDLQLTPYAKYLMSIGKFKPAFYAFFDDNILYDKKYVSGSNNETQNQVDKRIKEETQYLESLVRFRDIEETKNKNLDFEVDFFSKENTQRMNYPASDIFSFENSIGDSFFDGDKQNAPAWKVVALQSIIGTSETYNEIQQTRIPQINITSSFMTKITNSEFIFEHSGIRNLNSRTPNFADDKNIELIPNDPVIYVEELNTELLNDNFDVEVFEIMTANYNDGKKELRRLNFREEKSNIRNGFIVSDKAVESSEGTADLTNKNVEYYFDFLLDSDVDTGIACKGLEMFNKESYYIDLDFDCDLVDADEFYYDIYGVTTEPEVCQ
tara:strand:- start:23 stop:1027 length:1005 start_codon:yes stop_codon:yes gene_type:complete